MFTFRRAWNVTRLFPIDLHYIMGFIFHRFCCATVTPGTEPRRKSRATRTLLSFPTYYKKIEIKIFSTASRLHRQFTRFMTSLAFCELFYPSFIGHHLLNVHFTTRLNQI
jgi:hypothetical protein